MEVPCRLATMGRRNSCPNPIGLRKGGIRSPPTWVHPDVPSLRTREPLDRSTNCGYSPDQPGRFSGHPFSVAWTRNSLPSTLLANGGRSDGLNRGYRWWPGRMIAEPGAALTLRLWHDAGEGANASLEIDAVLDLVEAVPLPDEEHPQGRAAVLRRYASAPWYVASLISVFRARL